MTIEFNSENAQLIDIFNNLAKALKLDYHCNENGYCLSKADEENLRELIAKDNRGELKIHSSETAEKIMQEKGISW